MASAENSNHSEQMRRIETMLVEVDRFTDPAARNKTRQIVQALMDLHGAALGKMLEQIASSDASGLPLIESLAADPLVAGLLLLYDLHPVELEVRVGKAIEKARPYLRSHGGDVELVEIRDGIVRLRLHGSCHGCPSSAMTLKQTIEEAILEQAPDVAGIEVENEPAGAAHAEPAGRVPLNVIR
jgi:Fe-S cluster biogenesis protein NfuA